MLMRIERGLEWLSYRPFLGALVTTTIVAFWCSLFKLNFAGGLASMALYHALDAKAARQEPTS